MMKSVAWLNIIWRADMHKNTKSYVYIGTESDTFVNGQSYTYKDMAELTGLSMTTLRNRMRYVNRDRYGSRCITDSVINPEVRKPFVSLSGEKIKFVADDVLPPRLETESEKMMDKYLRVAL